METLEGTIVTDVSRIDTALEKANVTEAILAQLRAKAEPLTSKPIENKVEYDAVHAVERMCVSVRTTTLAICKQERDPAIAYQRQVIAKEKEVIAMIDAIEAPLKKLKADYNAIEAQKFEAAAQALAQKVRDRKERLYSIGFRFDGTSYDLPGFANLTEEEVSGSAVNDLQLGEWLKDIERQVAEHMERELERARTAKIAADALAEQQRKTQEEQDRKTRELAERERVINARILSDRRNQLQVAGAVEYPDGMVGHGVDTFSNAEILAMDETEFAAFVTTVRSNAEAFAVEKAERERKEQETRIAHEAQLEKEAADRAVVEEQARVKREAEEKKRRDEEAAAEEVERVAKLSDVAKIREYHTALKAVPVPAMKSKAGRAKIALFTSTLATLIPK